MDLLRSIGRYLLVVLGGGFCFLALAPVFGYMPWAVRGDSAWFGTFPAVGLDEFWKMALFSLQWILTFIPFLLLAGIAVFIAARLLERTGAPILFVVISTAVVAGAASALAVGIPVPLGPTPGYVYTVTICGILYGAFVLPKKRSKGRGVS